MKPKARLNKRTVEWNPLNFWDDANLQWDQPNLKWDSGIAIENLDQISRIAEIKDFSFIKDIKPNSRLQ